MKNLILFFYIIIMVGCSSSDGDKNIVLCGDSNNIYVHPDGSDNASGTISQPLQTIQVAVSCAQSGQTIRVANGFYESDIDGNVIVLVEGNSIYGGYSDDFQSHDPSIYITTITDTTNMNTNPYGQSYTVTTLPDTTASTVLDGFTINGTTIGSGGLVRAIILSGSPTISNNIIHGGGNFSSGFSHGIEIQFDGDSPIIDNNTIDGGASSIAFGIRSYTSGVLTITNNTISGGLSSISSRALDMDFTTDSIIIRNNHISGGQSNGNTYAINYLASASTTIEANTIESGSGGDASYGISARGGAPIIRNNTIKLEGSRAYGIYNTPDSIISNNTIVGAGSISSCGVYLQISTLATLQNNIIDIAGGICIAEYDSNSDPLSIKNNNLTGCGILYYDEGTTNITDITAVNTLLDTETADNVSLTSYLDVTKDYRLTANTPVAITEGGLDLSSDFSDDKNGSSRTVPWSMGAYEYE